MLRGRRRAIITGVTGQDGAYLARLLVDQDYQVVGLVDPSRRTASTMDRLAWLGVSTEIEIIENDLANMDGLRALMRNQRPDEVYSLAAVSDLKASWESPYATACLNGMGVVNLMEAIRLETPTTRFCQASSAEMFGQGRGEDGRAAPGYWPDPTSPYTSAKLMAHWMVGHFRQSHSLFGCCAILFNHESPLRGPGFVTRKITQTAARIAFGHDTELRLGGLDARRDWGHAADAVRAMWLMLQHEQPDDYVIATGETHSIGDVVDIAFARLGLNPRDYVKLDPALVRPVDVERPTGDASKTRNNLGWVPTISFEALIRQMVDADVERLRASASD